MRLITTISTPVSIVRLENVKNWSFVSLNHLSAPNGEYILINTSANREVKRIRRTIFFFSFRYPGNCLSKLNMGDF
jgi:hypothetical protein